MGKPLSVTVHPPVSNSDIPLPQTHSKSLPKLTNAEPTYLRLHHPDELTSSQTRCRQTLQRPYDAGA